MKKFTFIVVGVLLASIQLKAQQNVGIGTPAPDPSSVLDVSSINKGVLLPRMTMDQRNAIISPVVGLLVYQKDNTYNDHQPYYKS
jgi:hypothetical protein